MPSLRVYLNFSAIKNLNQRLLLIIQVSLSFLLTQNAANVPTSAHIIVGMIAQ
ncbi:MAG: hypothetical protein M1490_03230 [Candidatus Bathyarchaeota archaeon]|nr:hypothetical protein [Candidatus Bathyarchaeota archaeon]